MSLKQVYDIYPKINVTLRKTKDTLWLNPIQYGRIQDVRMSKNGRFPSFSVLQNPLRRVSDPRMSK